MTGHKILIIEDNPQNLELVTDLLEVKGFSVRSAPTAEEGLRLAGELLPDLVLMDFGLPGMDGLTAARNLKANPATRHLPVIALTSHAMKGNEEKARQAGCDGYMTKPIDTRTFVETLMRFLTLEKRIPQNKNQNSKPLSNAATPFLGVVLVVDDEPQNRSLLRDPLEASGYEVREAENGWQALQKVAARPPDLILLDLMMPEIDGIEVCKRLKKDAKTAHIPILMVTALTERKERHLAIQSGVNDFLTKPVDLKDVILRVGNAVHSKHLHDQLQAEQEKSERLLLNILPRPIADRMKKGETNIADTHPDTTVLLADLVGFTSLSAHIDPWQIFQLLNEVFSAFDVLVEKHGLEKIKTIGDSYMVAGGISMPRPDHAEAMAELAVRLQEEMERFNQEHDTTIGIRIGICTGPVIAGVIGREKFAYDVWGETVNLACRLAAAGQTGKIQIAESTYERLKDKYQFEKPHRIDAKGADDLPAYWLGNRIGHPALVGSHDS